MRVAILAHKEKRCQKKLLKGEKSYILAETILQCDEQRGQSDQ